MSSSLRLVRDWPASLNAKEASVYSGLSSAEILKAERNGALTFKALGPKGRRIVLREQVDKYLIKVFNDAQSDALEDMDFGDD